MRERMDRIRSQDTGLTLIELLVSMGIFSVLIAFVYGVMITVMQQTRDVEVRDNAVFNTRIALQQMDRQIRSGNVFYDPNVTSDPDYLPNSMRVYTQANGDNKCIQWQVKDGVLRSRSWSTTWQTDSSLTPWATVATGLLTESVPPFTLSGGASTPVAVAPASSSPYGPRLLNIRLVVEDPRRPGGKQVLESSLSGRNTQYGFDSGVCRPAPPA